MVEASASKEATMAFISNQHSVAISNRLNNQLTANK